MIYVKLTTARCNPPMTRTIAYDEVKHFANKHMLSMYKKGKRIAWAITDEWLKIEIEYPNGHVEVIK